MGKGGELVFLPDWLFLIIYLPVPTTCFCMMTVQGRDKTHTDTPWWQNVCVPWSWSTSLTHPDKRCREKQNMEVFECRISRASEILNQQGIWKKFYRLFFLFLLPRLGFYNFPVFIWYGLVCRILRPPRKGTLLANLFLFYTRVKTAVLLAIRILYQSYCKWGWEEMVQSLTEVNRKNSEFSGPWTDPKWHRGF